MTESTYFQAVDHERIIRDYPVGQAFLDRFRSISRDELRALQDDRFRELLSFAWRVPFYRRHWGARGIEPGDIGGLDDIGKLPPFSKSDLMQSVEAHPPIGDFHGLDAYPPDSRPQIILQTTSGTTGRPQPLLFGPWSREVQNRLLARLYLAQGMSRDDVVHSVYGFGMVNGGHYVRETILHWVGSRMLTAGHGAETRSVNQVHLMRDFAATALVGFGDYMKRLSDVARAEGIVPGKDIRLHLISGHLGAESPESMSAAWGGAEVFDWYGVGDTGAIAGELPDHAGLYIQEDAQILELLDVDTGAPVAPGAPGDMVCTCLFKTDVFPIIRFNTHDVSRELTGDSPSGLVFRRLAGHLGRSDNMVKLRGINLYPTGIGALIEERATGFTGEYFCRVTRTDGREEMTVLIEIAAPGEGLKPVLVDHLRSRLGVEVGVELAGPGDLATLTEIETRQKPIRLLDLRKDG